ncbi:phosphate signaling complex protein PhoU [Candidatus Chlorohelix sp.]|uniref:phosphate signaling complex protein PhoU n=1 Tax=Candidatus Chlorohelix sp. TaxID=3139201 RepID=UPI00304C4DFD
MLQPSDNKIPENRARFRKSLSDLQDSLIDMASMVDKAMHLSLYIMKTRDHRQAESLIRADSDINTKRYELEEEAMRLLATQQPVLSRDLRLVAAVMHIAGELERMGDYAKGLARISEKMEGLAPTSALVLMDKMMQISREMLNQSIDAFLKGDIELARELIRRDDEIDVLYNEAYHDLLKRMMEDNRVVDLATYMLWAIHNVERMGDRITNICERIIFVETGQIMSNHPPMHVD